MSDDTEPPEPPEPKSVSITLEVPIGLVEEYDEFVERGIYLSREEGLRHGLVEAWRHDRGLFYTIRLDLLRSEDRRPDTRKRADEDESAPETGEPESGEAPEGGEI